MGMEMEKQVQRGFLANVEVEPALIVIFQFNPISVSDNKAVKYSERYTSLSEDTPGYVYTGGGDRTISFNILLHGLEQGMDADNPGPADNGISAELAKLRSFLYPENDDWEAQGGGTGKEGRRVNSPPTCVFGFGSKILECIVKSLDITETQFNSALAPVRADVKITLTVIEDKNNSFYISDREHRNSQSSLNSSTWRP